MMDCLTMSFIRHGKTFANENKLYCGSTDISLSSKGVEELLSIRPDYLNHENSLYFSSGRRRADETLSVLFEVDNPIVIAEFSEFDFGDFEMKSYEELKDNSSYVSWISDESGSVSCPNGDSRITFEKRVAKGFVALQENMIADGCKSAAIICHGGVIATIQEMLFPKVKNFYEWQPEFGRGYSIKYYIKENRYETKHL